MAESLVAGELSDSRLQSTALLVLSVDDKYCWPCSSLPAVGDALLILVSLLLVMFFRFFSALILPECANSALLRREKPVTLFCWMSFWYPDACFLSSSSTFRVGLRVSSALVACSPEFDPLGTVVHVMVALRHRALCSNLTLSLPVSPVHQWRFWLWFFFFFLETSSRCSATCDVA